VIQTTKLEFNVLLPSGKTAFVTFLVLALCSVQVMAHGPGMEKMDKISALLAEQGDQGFLYAERGHVFMDNQQWQEAMDDFNKAVQLDPGYVEYDLDRARLAYSAGNYLRALDFIDLFLLRHVNATEALLIRARSYRELGQYQLAVISYEMALTTLSIADGKASPEWYIEFAETLLLIGEINKALQILVVLEQLAHEGDGSQDPLCLRSVSHCESRRPSIRRAEIAGYHCGHNSLSGR